MRRPLVAIRKELVHPHFVTRFITRLIPLQIQRLLRDSGFFRIVSNGFTMVFAGLYALYEPKLLLTYVKLMFKVSTFHYGQSSYHYIHKVELDQVDGKSGADRSGNIPKVLIFVHGGAWGSGSPWMYRLAAHGLAKTFGADYLVIVGYPVYPAASVLEQSTCIISAVEYVKAQSQKLNIPSGALYVLAGHSSGANICFLACLRSAEKAVRLVDLFVGLSGVYDLVHHHGYEASRGVHELSPMTAAAGGYSGLNACSPTLLLRSILSENPSRLLYEAHLPPSIILHGHNDSTVPLISSNNFEDVLLQLQVPTKSLYFQVRTGLFVFVAWSVSVVYLVFSRRSNCASDAKVSAVS
jgi:acetyl esterase/lipase